MTQPTAADRLRRLLSIVPWIAAHDGPHLDEVCKRFDVDREQLLADLDVVFMVGLYPYTPDELVDVRIENDRVWIDYADFFRRPLRLTPEQGLALVAAGAGQLAVPGADPDGPLARGLAKLAGVLGVDPDEAVEVDLGSASADLLDLLTGAARDRRAVEIDYYAYGRDERTRRVVEPHHIYADQGNWYLAAHCRRADGERVFRVDRIQGATQLEDGFAPPRDDPVLGVFNARRDDPRVVLDLAPAGRWVAEQYPVEEFETLEGGGCRVTLAVTARPWLERLLLRLGPDAVVVKSDPELVGAPRETATRILARYRA